MRRKMSMVESNVLEAVLPQGLTDEMRDVAFCLYEALVINEERCGKDADSKWLEQLKGWSTQVLMQLQHLANEKGGQAIYLAKGVAVHLSARDREMCMKFKGNNYRELSKEYDLTEMRVRQIVNIWQRNQYLSRQGRLPGLDDDSEIS